MRLIETFTAYGHPNITATHQTTIMTTKDSHLTKNGDCIVAIKSEKALSDLGPDFKKAARNHDAKIILKINVNGEVFEVTGRGHPELTYQHSHDIVARKSGFICDRTLMIDADKAACDIHPSFIEQLQHSTQITVTISIDL